ncbi:MAG TPA: hypothetical protein VE032_08210 [Actinomycetota bacterium]|nr:hypothetical protein [Actinomycetota bacterium]
MRTARAALPALVLSLALASCDPATTSTAPVPPSASTIDPLVPFSPSPTPFEEITSGFSGDTLTLPTVDGGTIHVTLDTSAIPKDLDAEGLRPFSVYLTVENVGEDPWTGVPGQGARVTDEEGGFNQAEPQPRPGDLHPDPSAFGGSNENLMTEITLEPGEARQGVLLFITGGGNRPVTISVSFDDGATQGAWATSMGPS